MTQLMPYMAEPWFALLQAACQRENKSKVALRLGVSPAAVGQVLNGSGNYGNGKASPVKLAERVLHKFGSYECPHLTEMFAEPRVITADEADGRGPAHDWVSRCEDCGSIVIGERDEDGVTWSAV
jgi:transcriptional regulator with XRE-family HTH domain